MASHHSLAGPGQQVQFAPVYGPGSQSHSGLIDPCNLFIKVGVLTPEGWTIYSLRRRIWTLKSHLATCSLISGR